MNSWGSRRVLVTGGAGFIGSNLVARLVELGAHVRVVDNLERGRLDNIGACLGDIEFFQSDLTDKNACMEACANVQVVFHLASAVGGIKYYLEQPADVLSHNVLIDTYMCDAASRCGVESYLYASSAHVYPIELQQRPDPPPLREEDALPAHPGLSYGWAKLLGEKQLEYAVAQRSAMRVAILRLIGVYGKNQDLDLNRGSVIPVFIRRAIEYPHQQPFVVLGTGEETRSYCYIDDVVDAMLHAVEKLDTQQCVGPINIGDESLVRIQDLAREIIAISGKDIEIVYDPSHATTIWGQVLDCSKARALLDGWEARTLLEEGLRRTYAHIEERLTATGQGTLRQHQPDVRRKAAEAHREA